MALAEATAVRRVATKTVVSCILSRRRVVVFGELKANDELMRRKDMCKGGRLASLYTQNLGS
jgi:hypothetical protein